MSEDDDPRTASRHAAVAALLAALTPREREVLHWVQAGKANRDIAALIGASPRTVEKHLEHVYEKLGVECRTAAALRAMA
jgi:DNA-binding CsgD family transcriptional regulator